MVNEFKLTVVHCAPKPNADLCMCMVYHWTKNCGKSGLGLWAAGPSQAAGHGLRAAGSWATGSSGSWTMAGLLLAKPTG